MAFIPDEAVDRMTELSAGAWRLYCVLAKYRNRRTGKCCPSAQTLARVMDMERRHVFRLKLELTQAGWAQFDGGNATALFGFDGDKNVTSAGDKNDSVKNVTSDKNVTLEGQKCHPTSTKMSLAYKEEPVNMNQQIEPAKVLARRARGRPAKPPDVRTQHAAVQSVRQLVSQYPPKELWDKLIRALGDAPDIALLTECRTEWVDRGYNRNSWKWATEWYPSGIPERAVAAPPKKPNSAHVGKSQPKADAPDGFTMAEYIEELIALDDLIHIGQEYDNIIARGGPKAEWEIRCVAYYELHKDEPATPEQVAQLNRQISNLVNRG